MSPRPTGPPPECRCGTPTNLLQSHTTKNPERWFYKCASGGCSYFKWADELPNAAPSPQQQQQAPQQQQQWRSPSQQQTAGPSHAHQGGLPRYTEQQHYQLRQQQPLGGYGGAHNSPGPLQQHQGGSQGGSQGWGSQQSQQQHSQQQQYSQSQQQQYAQPQQYSQPQQQPWQQEGQPGWQQSSQQQLQQPWNTASPQQPHWQQQQQGSQGRWQQQGPGAVSHSPMQQQQQSPPWPLSPQQFGARPGPVRQSPQQQHTPARHAPAAAAAGSSPCPGLSVVRVIEIPDDPDAVGFKLGGYSQVFVDAIKGTPFVETGRKWDPTAKCWRVKHPAMETVARHLTARGFRVVRPGEDTPAKPQQQQAGPAAEDAEAAAAFDLQALEGSSAALIPLKPQASAEDLVESHIPRHMWAALLPHQQQGVLAGVRRGGRLLLADDMGLGKSAQAITLAACYPADWPLLVICPTSLLSVWAVELEAWLPPTLKTVEGQAHTLIIRSDKDKKRLLGAGLPAVPHILLTTYKLVQQLPQQTLGRYGVVICDESHKLKDPTTAQSRFVGSVVRGAKRAFLLTGTPLLSRPIEAWPQVDMLRQNLFGSYDDFGKKYCLVPEGGSSSGGGGRGWRPKYQGSNPATAGELHRLLLANVMVRRTKGQAGVGLPDKTRLKVSVPLSPESKPVLASVRAAMDALSAQGARNSPEAQRLVNEYRMVSGKAKVDGVIEFLKGLPGLQQKERPAAAAAAGNGGDSDGEAPAPAAGAGDAPPAGGRGKVLVFAHHQGVLDAIQSRLCEAQHLGFIRIDGRTSGADRQAAVACFQQDASVLVGLVSIKAGGVGLTLTAADTVVFAELDWNPTDLMQCEDRIHRVGQKQHCRVYYCVAPGCADGLMWATLVRKLCIVGAAVDGGVRDAQELRDMQYWQQLGSQQADADAEAGADEAPGSQQQKRARDSAGTTDPGTEAAAADHPASDQPPHARRSLFGEFVATGRMPGGCPPASLAAGALSVGTRGSQGRRSAQADNNTQGGPAAAAPAAATAPAEAGGSTEQHTRIEDATPPETNDWVLVDIAESPDAAALAGAGPSTQGSQPGTAAAAAAGVDGGSHKQQQQGQVVSVAWLAPVCAAGGSCQVVEGAGGEGVEEATGSAPAAAGSASPSVDPDMKRQRVE